MADDTIAAIATAAGRGGIGIIKISGELAFQIAAKVFLPVTEQADENPAGIDVLRILQMGSHRLHLGHIYDGEPDCLIDQVLLSAMPGPRSYTRENVVEINSHGGPVAMQSILRLVLENGARLAEPGEFTRRAFLNGRIDLTQAEAVVDLINARTDRSLRAAALQVDGHLEAVLTGIRTTAVNLLTRLEAGIDFPEEVEDIFSNETLTQDVQKNIVGPVAHLIRSYDEAHIVRDGLCVAVVGKPNVGKSSLLNRLVQKDRAIVTDIAGTTRDVVTESLNLNGIPVLLSDTAGLQNSDDPVEIIGIKKTLEQVDCSDLVLFMVEAHQPMVDEDRLLFEQIRHRPHLVVANKIDLLRGAAAEHGFSAGFDGRPAVAISALYGDGLDALKERMIEVATGGQPVDLNPGLIPNLRHKQLLDQTIAAAKALISDLESDAAPELLAVHTREVIDLMDQILGISVKADILERIFDQFCIGK
jgi:tRNA modification GTPase